MGAALGIGSEALILELRHEAHEVLPEMFLQYSQGETSAIRGLEDIVHREEMRTRVDRGIEAVAHGAEEERRLEQRQIQIRALAFAQRGEDGERGKGAARHVGDWQGRARGRLEPLPGKREAARR